MRIEGEQKEGGREEWSGKMRAEQQGEGGEGRQEGVERGRKE